MYNKIRIYLAVVIILVLAGFTSFYFLGGFSMATIKLPQPQTNSTFPLDQALKERRSVREFQAKDLTAEQISTLLWAADGITDTSTGFRSAPSAGALYPIDLYLVKNDGIWLYNPAKNSLKLIKSGDLRPQLAAAALGQTAIAAAPIAVVMVASLDRIQPKYAERSLQYCYLEAGHIAQNLALQAVALGLATVPMGAFNDAQVNKLLELVTNQNALYIIPVGFKK